MKIEFETERFFEHDDQWSALFVKIDNGDWHMAQPRYGTENKEEIIRIIRINRLIRFLVCFTSTSIVIISILVILNYGN